MPAIVDPLGPFRPAPKGAMEEWIQACEGRQDSFYTLQVE